MSIVYVDKNLYCKKVDWQIIHKDLQLRTQQWFITFFIIEYEYILEWFEMILTPKIS